MASCPRFPDKIVRELLERTARTGNEHAAIMCSTGDVTEIIEGGRKGLNFRQSLKECPGDGPYDVIHTHPNGIKELSPTDRKAAASEDISSVCVAVPKGIKCESMSNCATDASGALTCDMDSCEREAPTA